MSWTVVIIISIAVIALLAFLIRRNQKDEKKFEQQLNETESIPKEKEYKRDSENEIE